MLDYFSHHYCVKASRLEWKRYVSICNYHIRKHRLRRNVHHYDLLVQQFQRIVISPTPIADDKHSLSIPHKATNGTDILKAVRVVKISLGNGRNWELLLRAACPDESLVVRM
jgi:hypothetical protein